MWSFLNSVIEHCRSKKNSIFNVNSLINTLSKTQKVIENMEIVICALLHTKILLQLYYGGQ
jgi:hypothetical protein